MFSYHEYEKINEEDRPLNIYVSGSKVEPVDTKLKI